jgi:dimethylaniline monooxygenase (N-oxide forming)
LESGVIKSVEAISEVLDDKMIELQDASQYEVDAIIFCTGYEGNSTLSAPVEFSGNPSLPRIYQNVFHPEYPTSLAFMTFWETPTGICEMGDLMSMAIAQVFAGNYALPSRESMEAAIDRWHAALWALAPLGFNIRHKSSRARMILANEASWRWFLNDAASTGVNDFLGWGLQGWSFFWRDRKLCSMLMSGVDSPHVYRLFPTRKGGPARWADSKKSIERANEEVEKFALREKESARLMSKK